MLTSRPAIAPLLASLALLAACGPKLPAASEGEGEAEAASTDATDATDTAPGTSTSSETSTSETGLESETQPSTATSVFTNDIPPPPEDCNVWEQDCGEGHKCVPWIDEFGSSWIGFTCVPVLGDQGLGEPCELDFSDSTDNCDAAGSCFSFTIFAEEFEGAKCHAFCTGSSDNPNCEGPYHCLVGNGYPGPGLCIPHCDPLAQDCDEGEGCFWIGYAFTCSASTQDMPIGEPCSFFHDCAPGTVCTADPFPACEDQACCTAYCDISLEGSCADQPDTSCVPFFSEGLAPSGLEDVGVCIS